MTSRRHFLKSSILSTAGLLALRKQAFTSEFIKPEIKFGFISGIIGKELKGDWKEVLKKTTGFGFSEFETGSYLGNSATEFMKFCKEIGLIPVACGVPFTDDPGELNKRLDEIAALEVKYPVVYWPWTGGGPFKLEDCKISSDKLNKMGEICKSHGMELCWHNHDKEFTPMEEGLPFDYLMGHTDSELVHCEMDVFWVTKGGGDPIENLKKYSGRYRILHLKDMTSDERKTFECVGSGIIDFPAILKEATGQDIRHFMVECDNIEDGMACLKSAGKYLNSIAV